MIACVASVPIRAKSFAPAGRSKTGAKTKTKTTVENKSKNISSSCSQLREYGDGGGVVRMRRKQSSSVVGESLLRRQRNLAETFL